MVREGGRAGGRVDDGSEGEVSGLKCRRRDLDRSLRAGVTAADQSVQPTFQPLSEAEGRQVWQVDMLAGIAERGKNQRSLAGW